MLSAIRNLRSPALRNRRVRGQHVRAGSTLVEQIVVLTVIGLLAAISIRAVGRQLDQLAVHSAARDARDVFASAREYAVARGVRTAVQIIPARARVSAHADTDTIIARSLGAVHGVSISSSRDSMAYSPSGLGYGASNLRIILLRHSAAETVSVSRLGRVR